jgi:hypothetical protein
LREHVGVPLVQASEEITAWVVVVVVVEVAVEHLQGVGTDPGLMCIVQDRVRLPDRRLAPLLPVVVVEADTAVDPTTPFHLDRARDLQVPGEKQPAATKITRQDDAGALIVAKVEVDLEDAGQNDSKALQV